MSEFSNNTTTIVKEGPAALNSLSKIAAVSPMVAGELIGGVTALGLGYLFVRDRQNQRKHELAMARESLELLREKNRHTEEMRRLDMQENRVVAIVEGAKKKKTPSEFIAELTTKIEREPNTLLVISIQEFTAWLSESVQGTTV